MKYPILVGVMKSLAQLEHELLHVVLWKWLGALLDHLKKRFLHELKHQCKTAGFLITK